MEKYNIAIMGASGVGKTVFLVSYFYSIFNVVREKRKDQKQDLSPIPITPKSQDIIENINNLFKILIEKGEVPQGTANWTDFSFCVDSMNMDVSLFDVPGGWVEELDAKSGEDPDAKPGEGPNAKPNEGPNAKPNEGPNAKPNEGPDAKPGEGPNAKPNEGPDAKPGEGPNAKPGEGSDAKPGEGSNNGLRVVDRLKTANGVLFFLSGEDIAKGTQDTKLNMTFTRAISFIRENQGRKWEGRQDVPITFIFTKGDTIPDWDIDKLKEKISVLCDAADLNPDTGTLLRSLFVKGKNVTYFKSSAMGKWPDPQTPPRDYQPENVVEPMEELYKAMRKTKTEYRYKRLKVAASIAALCFLVFLGGCWSFDFWRWNRALKDYERSFERKDYRKALKVLDEFAERYVFPEPLPLYPDFLRPGRRTEALRQSAYQQHEGELYAGIEPFLKGAELFLSEEASTDIVPFPVDTADRARTFLDAAKQAETYLGCQEFREAQPERYERVRNAKGFFTDVDAVALVMVQAEAIMVQAKAIVEGKAVPKAEAGGGLFASAWNCLESLKVLGPRLSAEDTQNINDGLRTVLSAWGPSLAPKPTLDELDTWFARSMEILALASPFPLSEENRKVVTDAELRWQNLWEELWANRVDEQLKNVEEWPEVEKKNVLMGLLSRGRMPDPSRFRLVNAVADVDMKLYAKDAYGLEKARLAGRDRGMSEGKDEAFKRLIRDLNQEALNKAVEFFGDVQTVEELDEALSNARSLPNFPDKGTEVARYFQLAVERVVKNECEELDRNDEFRDHLEAHRFDEAYGLLEELNRSMKGLVPLIASVRECTEAEAGRDLRREVYAFFSNGENSLMDRHYKFCRETAQRGNLTTWDRLDKALPVLDAFLSSWAFEAENGAEKSEALKEASERSLEVRRAKEFLEELKDKKEIYGTLTVVRASIKSDLDFWSKPDGKVYISHGNTSFSTSCIDDTWEPYFGDSTRIRLNLRNPVFVELRDIDDGSSSELIFNESITINRPFGYEDLSDTHGRRNTVTLRFTPDTPYPW